MSLIVTHALLNWTTRHHWGFGVFVAYILYRSYLEISTCTFNSHPIIHDFSKTLPQNIGWSSIECKQYLAVGRTLFNIPDSSNCKSDEQVHCMDPSAIFQNIHDRPICWVHGLKHWTFFEKKHTQSQVKTQGETQNEAKNLRNSSHLT